MDKEKIKLLIEELKKVTGVTDEVTTNTMGNDNDKEPKLESASCDPKVFKFINKFKSIDLKDAMNAIESAVRDGAIDSFTPRYVFVKFLKMADISLEEFKDNTCMTDDEIYAILCEDKCLSFSLSEKLGNIFNVPENYWYDMQHTALNNFQKLKLKDTEKVADNLPLNKIVSDSNNSIGNNSIIGKLLNNYIYKYGIDLEEVSNITGIELPILSALAFADTIPDEKTTDKLVALFEIINTGGFVKAEEVKEADPLEFPADILFNSCNPLFSSFSVPVEVRINKLADLLLNHTTYGTYLSKEKLIEYLTNFQLNKLPLTNELAKALAILSPYPESYWVTAQVNYNKWLYGIGDISASRYGIVISFTGTLEEMEYTARVIEFPHLVVTNTDYHKVYDIMVKVLDEHLTKEINEGKLIPYPLLPLVGKLITDNIWSSLANIG